MKRKTIIWSLFDSETAITQELNDENYTVFSIGLPSSSAITDNFIKIDLSRKSCIKKLSKLPMPDIIFASPPCESWINMNIGITRFYERNYNEHNLYWQKNFKPNNYAVKHREFRLLGQKTAYYTYRIIREFKPELWAIENGASSYIFKYLYTYFGLKGYKNKVRYSAYCNIEFSEKPTIFYSNKKILLKNNVVKSENLIEVSKADRDKEKKTGEWERLGFSSPTAYIKYKRKVTETYAERSKVPLGIYEDILNFYEGNGQQTLF